MTISRIDTPSDATWARAWEVADATERATLLATYLTPLGPKRGDIIVQLDTSAYYMVVAANTVQQINLLNSANTWTAQNTYTATRGIKLERSGPSIELWDSSQAADARSFLIYNGGFTAGSFEVVTSDDAHSVFGTVLAIDRTTGLVSLNTLDILGGQAKFPSTQAPSSDVNTLDDYAEGTWSGGISGLGGSLGVVLSSSTGSYVKVGRAVTIAFEIAITTVGTITGGVIVTGLPFTVTSVASRGTIAMQWGALATNWTSVVGLALESGTDLLVRGCPTGAGQYNDIALVQADLAGGSYFRGGGTYIANA